MIPANYEYGYAVLTPPFGFVAGWMFLCAKSAAALGFAGYALGALGCWRKVWHVARRRRGGG